MATKKSQAAMEFLMTYGWAILIVLVAIAAIAYFGVLKPEQFLPDKCVISTGSGLFCDDFNAGTNGIMLRIRNVLDKDVVISAIDIVDPSCSYLSESTILSESYLDFTITCSLTKGQKIKTDFIIDYKKGTSGLTRSTKGQLITKVPDANIVDQNVCQNAQDGGLCDWLDFTYGEGYRAGCCTEYTLCCLI